MKPRDNLLLFVYVAVLVAGIAQGQWAGAADESRLQTDSGTRLTGLLHNEDCTDFFYTQAFPPGKAGEITDRYVDVIAGAGVTVLFFGPTPPADWRAEAIIEMAPQDGNSDAPCVSVNDVVTELDIGRTLQNGHRLPVVA
jgi:hypothetical protein